MNDALFDIFIKVFSLGYLDEISEFSLATTQETIVKVTLLIIIWAIIIKLGKAVLDYVGITL